MFHQLKLLGILAIIYQLMAVADGCDKSLETDAKACSTKLWSGVSIPQERIRESLDFLEHPIKVDEKYGKPILFKELLRTSQISLPYPNFSQFARDCEAIFDESNDLETRVALHIFFERVGEKYSKELSRLASFKTLEREAEAHQARTQTIPNGFSDMFANADKGIHTY